MKQLYKGFVISSFSDDSKKMETKFAVAPDGKILCSGLQPFSRSFGPLKGWTACEAVPAEAEFCGNYSY